MTYIIWREALVACGLSLSLSLSACGGCGVLSVEEATTRLDSALAETIEGTPAGVAGAVMLVSSPARGLDLRVARGVARRDTGAAMTPETPFFSASVGKLVVAAAVHRLVADGCLALDDTLDRWQRLDDVAGLPVVGGDAALARVTVRQLLGHRSGLPDYFSVASDDGTPRLFDIMAREPGRVFTRADLFAFTRAHHAAVAAPGEAFAYADTNYDVLGVVLEWAAPGCASVPPTARHFHEVARALVLDPLEMRTTWYHAFEAAPSHAVPVADVMVEGVNLRGAASLSADQAGGGLITTVDDLARLMRGLMRGEPVPLEALATGWTNDTMHAGIDVGLGAWRIRPGGVVFFLGGMPELVGHSGATGVWAYRVVGTDTVLVGAVSNAAWQEKHIEFLLAEVMPVLARLPAPAP